MRINCPSCKAGYEVPDTLLGTTARRVRCARCAHEWTPDAPVLAVALLPPPPIEEARPEPAPRSAATRLLPAPRVDIEPPPSLRGRAQQASMLGSAAVVALSVVALAALAWAAYVWRAELMLAWPASQRLFAALGLR